MPQRLKMDSVMKTPVTEADEYFGSPPEPIFNESKNGISKELLGDSLKLLSSKNEAAVNQVQGMDETMGCFKKGNPIHFLFELSRHFGLSQDVQYKAAELFHRFMIGHIVELYQHVEQTECTDSPIRWGDVESRLNHQITLRAVSCVQLASKLSSHYHLVTLNRAKSFLASCGFRYASNSIVQSEVRVLKTLNFQVHQPTPLEFIEALLGALGHADKVIPVKQLHGIAMKILDVFYLEKDRIYAQLEKTAGMEECKKATAMASIQVDYMLLAAAIISTAAFILGYAQSQHITSLLSQTTRIVSLDIMNFSSVLIEVIFTDKEEEDKRE